ncbi:hypothetical protein KEM09_06520 [Carboxylicivirga mesophila]|uniref:Glycine zipper family protein n=1 Tax=Carboxylicivirga mesophila TaxID=1166478 RepID=A0ABS5K7V4_9BACT|nr:hypothetical protein [Carboxylicivirga mesophila]MBS2211046.1 hypothetical protein [Carboxylicivirga mesophila]
MTIINLIEIKPNDVPSKDYMRYHQFRKLVVELQKRELPSAIVEFVNDNIQLVNHAIDKKFELRKQIAASQKAIIKLLEKELKLVPKGYYRNLWMVLGMTVFGVPLGIVWGQVTDNMGTLGIGIAVGMAIGLALGSAQDNKAAREGRQLDVDYKP